MHSVEIKVLNVSGQVVHQETLNAKEKTLNLNLQSGIYFYNIINDRHEVIGNGKLICK